jgi:L-arabinokinase
MPSAGAPRCPHHAHGGTAVAVRPDGRHAAEFCAIECDTGVVQIDSLRLTRTKRSPAAAFYERWPAAVRLEAESRERRRKTRHRGHPAARLCGRAQAGIPPSVALGNFTWDWIYEDYLPPGREPPRFLGAIREAYRAASLTLRLPMWGGFAAMPPRSIVDVPLVARHARHQPADTRSALGLPQDLPLVLLSFGGYGLEGLSIDGLTLDGYGVVTTSEVGIRAQRTRGLAPVFTVDETALYRAGYRYEDLVAACEVVATKPGYGIIAECAANGAALLYTSRGRFAEYDVFVASMGAIAQPVHFTADLFGGRWQAHLDACWRSLVRRPRQRRTGRRSWRISYSAE